MNVDALLAVVAAAAGASSVSTVVLLVLLVLLVSVALVLVALVSSKVSSSFEEFARWVGALFFFGALVPVVSAFVAVLSFKILPPLRAILEALLPFTEAGTAPEDSCTRRSAKRAREITILENILRL